MSEFHVKQGQIWRLGQHRLMCGDSCDLHDVQALFEGSHAGCIVTDPPYAFGLASTQKLSHKSGGWHDMMNNASWFSSLLRTWKEVCPEGIWWMFCNWRTLPIVMKAAYDAQQPVESCLVWHKNWIGPGGPRALRPAYEMVTVFASGGACIEDRSQADVVTVPWSSRKPTGHAAEKPAALFEKLIGLSRGLCYDPFCGSGTSLVACETLGRACYAMEIEPAYASMALRRWTEVTGKTPKLEVMA
jgi:DNA modification methylase